MMLLLNPIKCNNCTIDTNDVCSVFYSLWYDHVALTSLTWELLLVWSVALLNLFKSSGPQRSPGFGSFLTSKLMVISRLDCKVQCGVQCITLKQPQEGSRPTAAASEGRKWSSGTRWPPSINQMAPQTLRCNSLPRHKGCMSHVSVTGFCAPVTVIENGLRLTLVFVCWIIELHNLCAP